MKKRVVVAIVGTGLLASIAACSGDRKGAQSPRSTAASVSMAPTSAASVPGASTEARIAPASPSAEPKAPAAPGGSMLAVVAEGDCPALDVSVLGKDVFLFYGNEPAPPSSVELEAAAKAEDWQRLRELRSRVHGAPHLLHIAADGTLDESPSLLSGLDFHPIFLESGMLRVVAIEGTWPDAATLVLHNESGAVRSDGPVTLTYAWKKNRWISTTGDPPKPAPRPYVAGSVIAFDATSAAPRFVVSPKATAPAPDFSALTTPAKDCAFRLSDYATTSDGTVYLAGTFCGLTPSHVSPSGELYELGPVPDASLARWRSGEGARLEKLPDPPGLELESFWTKGDHAYLFGSVAGPLEKGDPTRRPYFAELTREGWKAAQVRFAAGSPHAIEADGTIWALAEGSLVKRAPGSEPVVVHRDVVSLAFARDRPAYIVTAKDELLAWGNDGGWAPIALPGAAFSPGTKLAPKEVRTCADGSAWVRAVYTENRPGWPLPEPRIAILRSAASAASGGRPSPAPLRCEARSRGDRAFGDAMPPLTPSCATPFVVLQRVSASAPKNFTYPKTRAAVKGHEAELQGASFREVTFGGRVYFGASVPDAATGERLSTRIVQGVKDAHPELVCAAPDVRRSIDFGIPPQVVAESD